MNDTTVDSCLLACTNTIDELDAALKRRFKLHVFCGLPGAPERKDLFRHYCRSMHHNLTDADFTFLAEKTNLYSGSDISRVVDAARMGPVAELQRATHFIMGDDQLYRPCDPSVQNAVRLNLVEIRNNSLAAKREVRIDDFRHALKRSQATLSQEQYEKYLKLAQASASEVTEQMKEQSGIKREKTPIELVRTYAQKPHRERFFYTSSPS